MSFSSFHEGLFTPTKTDRIQTLDMEICQNDYPLDWYQQEFLPYAEEYQRLPDRDLVTILAWMQPYMDKAFQHFGDSLLIAAHYYMGGEIVQMTQYFGGYVGDSYQLALAAMRQSEKKIIVESAVHFMAESINLVVRWRLWPKILWCFRPSKS
jgi:quinolinate synthase